MHQVSPIVAKCPTLRGDDTISVLPGEIQGAVMQGMSRRTGLPMLTAIAMVAAVLRLASPAGAAGATIYVDVSAVGGDDGSSWADAFTGLQDALAVADPGDDILVAQGIYTPHPSDSTVPFALVDGVDLIGGYAAGGVAGPDPALYETVLSGDLAGDDQPGFVNTGDNSGWVVVVPPRVATGVFEGFTVTGGGGGGGLSLQSRSEATMRNVVVDDNQGQGVWINDGSIVSVVDSMISRNTGSGVYSRTVGGPRGSLIERTTIRDNGVGLSVVDGNIDLEQVQIIDNAGVGTYSSQGNIYMSNSVVSGNGGGGMEGHQSGTLIENSEITGNSTTGDGGGLSQFTSTLRITNSSVTNNSAQGGGGGLSLLFGGTYITNSVIADNVAAGDGGGLLNAIGGVEIVNSVITNNQASAGGGISMPGGDIANSIVWGNTPTQGIVGLDGSAISVDNSDVQGWTGGGVGNIDADPLFVGGGDYRLQVGSPAIDAGDDSAVPADVYDVDEDGDTTEPTPDLDLEDRIQGVAVDMGAFEWADNTPPEVSVFSPADAAVFAEGDVVLADYVCTDGETGMASCVGDAPAGSPIDTATAGAKTFTVTGTDNAGNTAVVTHAYTVVPLPVVLPGVVNVTETDTVARVANVPVSLSASSPLPVSVDWATFDLSAKAPDDYVGASGTVTFAPGETAKTVPIIVYGDVLHEANEVLGLVFSNPTNATVGGFFGLGIAVIDDNDPQPTITPGGFVASPEGDSGSTTWNLPVTLSAPAGVEVSIDWNTLDIPTNPSIAHPGSDYVDASGTLTFAPGETVQNVPIEILGDTVDEPPLLYGEWGLVQFTNPVNTSITGGFYGAGLFIVIDDD